MNMSMRKTNLTPKKEAEKKSGKGGTKKTYSLRHLMSGRLIYFSSDELKSYYQINLKHPLEDNKYEKRLPW